MSEQLVRTIPISTMPEHAPVVTMDIELGQQTQPGEVINFDYDGFINKARERGATSTEIGNVHVDIIDPSYRPKGVRGAYRPAENDLPNLAEVIFTGKEAKMSETLGHEFEHHLQFQRGKAEESTINNSYETGVKEALKDKKYALILGLGAIGMATSILVGPEILAIPSIPALTYPLARSSLAGGYSNHWIEKEAREAGKNYKDAKIITVSKP